MKFLMLCSQFPVPTNSGSNIRTMNIAKTLSEFGDVDLVYFYGVDEGLNQPFRKTYKLDIADKSYRGKFTTRCRFIVKMLPWNINYLAPSSLLKLKNIIKSYQYDAIVVRYITNSYAINAIKEKITSKIIIDYDDILSELNYTDSKIFNFKDLRRKLDKYFMKKLEHKCLKFDAALFCSQNDMHKIVNCGERTKAYILRNTVEVDNFSNFNFKNGFNNRETMIFVGALDYQPNIDSLTWFINSILDKIVIKNPRIKLLVVGKNPNRAIIDLASNRSHVELYPNVQDVKEYYDKAGTIIVPITTGSGTRIKILEGALTSRPILSTRLGAYGLEFYDETDILFFENESEFVEQYKKIDDKRFYKDICERAKVNVINNYGRKYMTNTFKEIFKQLELIS